MGLRLLKFVDATLGAFSCRILSFFGYRLGRGNDPFSPPPSDPRRILVIRPGGMGDMILFLPVLKELAAAYPKAAIDVVCEKRNVNVLRLSGLNCSALTYDADPVSFFAALLSRHYDFAIDTEQFHNISAVFAFLSGAAVRIGFNINPRRNSLYTHLVPYAPDGPEILQFMKLTHPLGLSPPEPDIDGLLADAPIEPSPPISVQIQSLGSSGGYATIHTGASTRYKRWGTDNFLALIGALRKEHGFDVALAGGRPDMRLDKSIVRTLKERGERVVSFSGECDLKDTAAIIRNSRIFISGDSGLAHLAAALGTPAVAVFGPTDHRKWGIETKQHAVVRKSLPCSPCFIFGYHKPCRTITCMKQISVEQVLEACRRVIRETHSAYSET
ncbi:MAG: glycosyltransferase family 9 protein [Kiritimatiellia bacterium]